MFHKCDFFIKDRVDWIKIKSFLALKKLINHISMSIIYTINLHSCMKGALINAIVSFRVKLNVWSEFFGSVGPWPSQNFKT